MLIGVTCDRKKSGASSPFVRHAHLLFLRWLVGWKEVLHLQEAHRHRGSMPVRGLICLTGEDAITINKMIRVTLAIMTESPESKNQHQTSLYQMCYPLSINASYCASHLGVLKYQHS